MKATKKPIEVEYYPAEKKYKKEILKWSNKKRPIVYVQEDEKPYYFEITTLEGIMVATPLDMIIKGISGEVYPCKKDIFEKTYDKEESSPSSYRYI